MTHANDSDNRIDADTPGQGTATAQTQPQLKGVDRYRKVLRTAWQGRPFWGLVLVGWLAMLVFTFHACTRMVAAGDTWVAMACGRHFANHGVDTVEPFSANSHHAGPTEEEVQTWPAWAQRIVEIVGIDTVQKWHPTGWVNQNWLTHVIFYKLTTTLGSEEDPFYDALVYWKFSLYLLCAVCIYAIGRLQGVHPALAATATCFALYTGRTFLDIRPAGYSNLMVAMTVLILVLTTYRHTLFIWLLVPMTIFWCNAHGGYIYVFIMLVPFIGLHLITVLPKRWSAWLYASLGWLVLYVLCFKLLKHPGLQGNEILGGKYLALLVILSLVGLAMTWLHSVREGQVILYHAIVSVLVGLFLFGSSMFPQIHYQITGAQLEDLRSHITDARIGYLGLLALFLVLGAVLVFAKRALVELRPKAVVHMVGAYAVTVIMAILFNPFHLTNLTHTFTISVSEHAKRWRDVHEWHPAFDWSNPVGTAKPFLILVILAGTAVVAWLIFRFILHSADQAKVGQGGKDLKSEERPYVCPRLDLPLMLVGALTIYMAIRSRRFIPIAAFVACPLVALFIQQVLEALTALAERKRGGKLMVTALPRTYQQALAGAALVLVLTLGGFWGLKFKGIYLDAWAGDPEYHSVFMRMTASYLKPFKACAFLRQNKIAGNMMNYWTEGGAVAFGQDPDPETGRTPLQLFMDGRAQAAYDVTTFNTWSLLWAGGTKGYEIRRKGEKATLKDYQDMGKWLAEEMKRRKVWVALLPSKEWTSMFARGLDYSGNWRVVFLNNKQKMYVDQDDPRAQALITGLETGATQYPHYPDSFSLELTQAYHKMRHGRNAAVRRQGFDHAVRAFKMNPSGVPANMIFDWGTNQQDLLPVIVALAREYLEDFLEQRDTYRSQNGYRFRLDAAFRATQFLRDYERKLGHTENADIHADLVREMTEEFRWIGRTKRW